MKKMLIVGLVFFFVVLMSITVSTKEGNTLDKDVVSRNIWYVDDDAVGSNNGLSWENAFTRLQPAFDSAQSSDEIRVAAGVYIPYANEDKTDGEKFDPKKISFELVDGVMLYGGYAGFGAVNPDARDVMLYETVLTGDLNGDDGSNFQNYDDNSHHVVLGMDIYNTSTLIDGVTITGGSASASDPLDVFYQRGGGMYLVRVEVLTISNCTFLANRAVGAAAGEGGAMHIVSSTSKNLIIRNCLFMENDASSGGGIYIRYDSTPTIIDCEFIENSAGGGGGVTSFVSNPSFIRCQFNDNTADIYGGGATVNGGRVTIVECSFEDNAADERGGGIENSDGNMTLENCWFASNSAVYGSGIHQYAFTSCYMTLKNCILMNHPGAAIWNWQSSSASPSTMLSGCTLVNNDAGLIDEGEFPTQLKNCIFWGNGEGQEVDQISGMGITVNYCCIQGLSGNFGGIGNFGNDPLLVGPSADNYHLSFTSPCIDTGDPEYIPGPDEKDIDGQPRMIDGTLNGIAIVDIGADEFVSGDLDGDGDIDLADLQILLSNYGMTSGATYEDGDLDGDGDVDLADLQMLLSNYGTGA